MIRSERPIQVGGVVGFPFPASRIRGVASMFRGACLFTCLAAVMVNFPAPAQDAAPADLVAVLPDTLGRLIVWRVGDVQYGAVQPATASVAKVPGSERLVLGLIHSGYSGEDPDGKNAILTFTVLLKQKPITDDDKAIFLKRGVKPKEDLLVRNPKFTQIDILLRADLIEEKRIRAELKLPRTIGDEGGNQPFSIRWKGVVGETLYKWLTDPVDGLKVVYKGSNGATDDVVLGWPLFRSYAIDADRLSAWWKKNARDKDAYSWRGGTGPLVQNLIDAGVVLLGGKELRTEDAGPEFKLLSEKISQIATPSPRNILTVKKDKFLALAGDGKLQAFSIDARVEVLPAYIPGREFLSRPEYVKDLTGDSKGLDALRGKKN